MKSLRTIQTLAKVARVICLILFIVFIIGAVGSIVGTIALPLLKDEIIYEDKTLEMILLEKNVNFISAITACIIGIIACLTSIFLSKYAELFFARVVREGTPFKTETVKRMRTLGIVNICVEIGVIIVIAVMLAIIKLKNPELADFKSSFYFGSISFGIVMLILSVFVQYGVEKDQVTPREETNNEDEEQ